MATKLTTIPRPNTCTACAAPLTPETHAWWYGTAQSVTCAACRPAGAVRLHADDPQTATDLAEAGGGDIRLANRLDRDLDGMATVLHDRRVPLSRGNIDHLVVAPSGIWIIDADHDDGTVVCRDVGGSRTNDDRLYVGDRDQSNLVSAMARQADAVQLAIEPIGFGAVPIHGCLCFTNAEWGRFSEPFVVDDVWIGWVTALVEAIQATPALDPAAVTTLSHHLNTWFPTSY